LLLGAAAVWVSIALAAWLAFGWDWLHGFGLAGENQSRTSYMSIPITTARLTGLDPNTTRIAAAALFVAGITYLVVWTWRGADWIRASAWATFALLLATAWLLPWYLIWLLPLAAISRDKPLQLLALGLTAYQLGARIPL
jgi:hypothetical protein